MNKFEHQITLSELKEAINDGKGRFDRRYQYGDTALRNGVHNVWIAAYLCTGIGDMTFASSSWFEHHFEIQINNPDEDCNTKLIDASLSDEALRKAVLALVRAAYLWDDAEPSAVDDVPEYCDKRYAGENNGNKFLLYCVGDACNYEYWIDYPYLESETLHTVPADQAIKLLEVSKDVSNDAFDKMLISSKSPWDGHDGTQKREWDIS